PAHGLVILRAAPLRVHRDLRAVEAAMERRRKKAGRPADEVISGAGEQIGEPLLICRLDREDIYQGDHRRLHRLDLYRKRRVLRCRERCLDSYITVLEYIDMNP